MKSPLILLTILLALGCENRDINEGPAFRPQVIKDSFKESDFSTVSIDGVEYLIMERDNNNPHEGFGFMAFKADDLNRKQDSLMAMLRVNQQLQIRILSALTRESPDRIQELADTLLVREFRK